MERSNKKYLAFRAYSTAANQTVYACQFYAFMAISCARQAAAASVKANVGRSEPLLSISSTV